MMTDTPDRCSFEFEPAAWEETYGDCFVDEDEDILFETGDGTIAWQCPHEAIDGENLCQFHLPTDADAKPHADTIADELVTIVNGERPALDNDGSRPARFIGATFESLTLGRDQIGDGRCIDLRHAEIGSANWNESIIRTEKFDAQGIHVAQMWDCESAEFDGEAQFLGTEFGGEARFLGTEFGGRTRFDGAEFGGRARFDGAEFGGKAWFLETEFGGRAEFKRTEFGGRARFDRAEFGGQVEFKRAEFDEGAWFDGTKFDGQADFKRAEFREGAWFDGTEFDRRARFDETEFGRRAWFEGAEFGGRARFEGTEFGGRAGFEGAEFRNVAVFSEATFGDEAVFTAEGWYAVSPFQDDVDFSDIAADDSVRFVDEYDADSEEKPYTFLGTTDFRGADIPNAEFAGVSFSVGPLFNDADLTGADLSNIPLDGASFEGADLIRTDLSEASVTTASFNGAVLERASLYGTNFRNARLYGARLAGAHISDHTDFGIRDVSEDSAEQRRSRVPFRGPWPAVRYDPRNSNYDQYADDEDKQGGAAISDHSRAASVYAELQRVAETNAASDLASRCFRWRKDMRRKRYASDEGRGNTKNPLRWSWAHMSNLVARYGDSPWRVVYTSIVAVGLFGVLYPFFGGMQSTGDDGRSFAFDTLLTLPELPTWIEVLLSNLYFSAVTFTTLGYGDIRPSGPISQALASIESFLGAALLALLVAVLARRITR